MSNVPVNIFTNQKLEPYYTLPGQSLMSVALPASVSYLKGTVLGELTASPGTFKAYASGNTDGSQFPKALLAYTVTTDVNGNVLIAALAPFGIQAASPSTPVYFRGGFRAEDLVQSGPGALDANALSGNAMRQVNGTPAAGVIELL